MTTESTDQPAEEKSPYTFAALKETFNDFLQDDALTQAGAVAYYTALSFAPLLVLVTLLVGMLLGPSGEERVKDEISALMGPGVADTINQVMADGNEASGEELSPEQEQEKAEAQAEREEANRETGNKLGQMKENGIGTLTGFIGLAAIVWSASGVFAQLQAALNKIWDVEAKPGGGLWAYLRKRLLSVGVVFAILFLLLASLAVTAVLNVILGGEGFIWKSINFIVSIGVYIALFGLIFKFLPDVRIPWKAVWFGAAITAVLFAIGKLGIGLYLSRGSVGSDYGGAGSVVVLLGWVYYAAVIVFFGAELTQVWAKHSGLRIRPDKHAQPESPKLKRPAHATA